MSGAAPAAAAAVGPAEAQCHEAHRSTLQPSWWGCSSKPNRVQPCARLPLNTARRDRVAARDSLRFGPQEFGADALARVGVSQFPT